VNDPGGILDDAKRKALGEARSAVLTPIRDVAILLSPIALGLLLGLLTRPRD
jgi:hypothetical protein